MDGREAGDGKSLVAYTGAPSYRGNNDQEYLRRADLDALIKIFKENGNTFGYSFGARAIENYKDLTRTDRMHENLIEMVNQSRIANLARNDHAFKPSNILAHIATARAAELSQLEVRVSNLERDLGKSASALFKLKKEKKSKASEVRRLQREIQNREESRTVVSRDDFHARLTRMAVLFDSLMAIHEKDLALASFEGSLNEIHLLKGDMVPTLDSEETRLLSHMEELTASDGDFDSILSQLQFECTLTPCSGETEGHGPVAEEGGDVASARGNDEAAEGGNGCEVEDEGSAPRSA
ncbi:hypothetical protein F2Q70_00043207 [Brassica cretica]|uniref:Uncharacterized protein n=1 Tax=Brassica cretica TaxID=69181 RepID=A0A8S9KJ78_BRACR|nr:hypothetical protein F2Q70_00043207 [Brassica cretica]